MQLFCWEFELIIRFQDFSKYGHHINIIIQLVIALLPSFQMEVIFFPDQLAEITL